jgi:glycosyltransferase involved in cell wall biosynthesis
MQKILYIHHGIGIGGAGLSLLHLVRSLDKTKFHPVVLFLHDSDIIPLYRQFGIEIAGPVADSDLPHTVMFWYRWYHVKPLLRSLWTGITTWRRTAEYWYDKIQPDLVHLNTSSLSAWASVARRKNIPVVWHIREPLASGYLGLRKKLTCAAVGRWSNAIVAISKNEALPWKQLPKTQVIYNAVDPIWFDKSDMSHGLPRILFLGGLSEEKGTLVILRVLEKVIQQIPDAQLVIAGYFNVTPKPFWHPAYFSAHQAYVRQVAELVAKMEDNIALVGPSTDVPGLMARSSVVVFPSTVPHFARPIIEAGFMGKPVVASKLPPLDELVVHGQTGFLIDPKDIDQWAHRLVHILSGPAARYVLGLNAYEFCRQRFALDQQIVKIENLYMRMSNERTEAKATRT